MSEKEADQTAQLKAELAALRNRTRTLDPNDDGLLLFLESAQAKGFVIQLVPPEPSRMAQALQAVSDNIPSLLAAMKGQSKEKFEAAVADIAEANKRLEEGYREEMRRAKENS